MARLRHCLIKFSSGGWRVLAFDGNHHVSDRTLDSHVRRIRAKFREHGLDPVETVHGLGYRLQQ